MKNSNQYALLGLLTIEPMTGYTMKQWIDNALSHFWRASYGQIYPTLNRFVEEGLVTVERVENEKRPSSKLYTITEKGRDEFRNWLVIDVEDVNYRDETLLKFYFSSNLSIDEVIGKAERAIEYNEKLKDSYCSNDDDMKKVTDPTRRQLITYLCVKKGIYLNEARLKWEQECIETLKWFDEKEKKKQVKEDTGDEE